MSEANKAINIRNFLLTRLAERRANASELKLSSTVFLSTMFLMMVIVALLNPYLSKDGESASPTMWLGIFFLFLILVMALFLTYYIPVDKWNNHKLFQFFYKKPYQDKIDIFNCYHCYKGILTEEIASIDCTVCGTTNNFFEIVDKCKRCENPMLYFKCPHCNEVLDYINYEYDFESIKKKLHGQK